MLLLWVQDLVLLLPWGSLCTEHLVLLVLLLLLGLPGYLCVGSKPCPMLLLLLLLLRMLEGMWDAAVGWLQRQLHRKQQAGFQVRWWAC